MVELGVVYGRFQIFHLKHLEYVLAAKMRCKKLVIGIASPDNRYIRESVNDEYRTTREANPFTYYERMVMIHDALIDFGVKREEFEFVPFPIDTPEYLLNYVPKDAMYYLSITDAWGEEKQKTLIALGLQVEILWRKTIEEVGTTGQMIREYIRQEEEWRHLVPKTVYEYILDNGLDERICSR
ncbi:MAG: nicotinate-nucleotide adenylyltransferase [Lachnospiraceae bacterium]